MEKLSKDNYIGCLLGGAIGDALGAPTEFMTLDEIWRKYGENGVDTYIEFSDHIGRFTDDTQMTLFTAEGLLRSINRATKKGIGGAYKQIVYQSYLRWLHTQQQEFGYLPIGNFYDGWLLNEELLYKSRAPGNTCMQALCSGVAGSINYPLNVSKGCGGVMRMAPVGLLFSNQEEAFKIGAELAAISHGHPCGYLSAGALASIISCLNKYYSLENAITETLKILEKWNDHDETTKAIQSAIDLFEKEPPTFRNVELLGEGWVGEEALSIAIFCALSYQTDFEKAIILSINHSGDTDSTGSITGNILGLILGKNAIPKHWKENLELSDVVIEVAKDLYTRQKGDSYNADIEWDKKYPPH